MEVKHERRKKERKEIMRKNQLITQIFLSVKCLRVRLDVQLGRTLVAMLIEIHFIQLFIQKMYPNEIFVHSYKLVGNVDLIDDLEREKSPV